MSIWLAVLIGGLLTYAMRLSFIYLLGRAEVPESMRRPLRFVPPAVLAAIILPELLMPSGPLDLSLHNARWLAGTAAMLVAWRMKNTVVTIIAGMLVLVLVQFAL
jgi:branched-subunit amino acid transport protein